MGEIRSIVESAARFDRVSGPKLIDFIPFLARLGRPDGAERLEGAKKEPRRVTSEVNRSLRHSVCSSLTEALSQIEIDPV